MHASLYYEYGMMLCISIDMNRDIMFGDVSMFGPESGQKCVVCKIFPRNYVFGREGGKSPNHLPMREKAMSTGGKDLVI